MEAERLKLLKYKKKKTPELEEAINKKRQEQKDYLPHTLIHAETKKPFIANKQSMFEGGTIDTILTPGDRSRIVFNLFSKSINYIC
jgi:hypothetical protein